MEHLFSSAYKGKKVLITGHSGFKGSWLALWLTKLGAEVIGYSKDIPTEPAHISLLDLKMRSVTGDILDKEKLEKCFLEHQPEIVFHLAAQSLVRDSYRDPLHTYSTNVLGTLHVFEAARNCKSVKAIVNVTTDKVYENTEQDIAYTEQDKLGGYDIYSSSKACAEILSASYRRSFFNSSGHVSSHAVLLATVRAGNVIGGGDWAAERLVPDVIKASVKNESTCIRNPYSVRPWQHVLEPLSGYLLLGSKLLEGKKEFADAWNFGPSESQCVRVEELLGLFKKNWETVKWENAPPAENFHEAQLLRLSSAKAADLLEWKPLLTIEDTVALTVRWYRKFYENGEVDSLQDITDYVAAAQKQNISFAR
jgi:CDP-glucose 4,6-dehydratase